MMPGMHAFMAQLFQQFVVLMAKLVVGVNDLPSLFLLPRGLHYLKIMSDIPLILIWRMFRVGETN